MGLFGRPHVSLNFCEIALDANLCVDLPVLSTRCAVTSQRKLAYGLLEKVSSKTTNLKLALSLANSGVSFAHYVRSGAATDCGIQINVCVFLV